MKKPLKLLLAGILIVLPMAAAPVVSAQYAPTGGYSIPGNYSSAPGYSPGYDSYPSFASIGNYASVSGTIVSFEGTSFVLATNNIYSYSYGFPGALIRVYLDPYMTIVTDPYGNGLSLLDLSLGDQVQVYGVFIPGQPAFIANSVIDFSFFGYGGFGNTIIVVNNIGNVIVIIVDTDSYGNVYFRDRGGERFFLDRDDRGHTFFGDKRGGRFYNPREEYFDRSETDRDGHRFYVDKFGHRFPENESRNEFFRGAGREVEKSPRARGPIEHLPKGSVSTPRTRGENRSDRGPEARQGDREDSRANKIQDEPSGKKEQRADNASKGTDEKVGHRSVQNSEIQPENKREERVAEAKQLARDKKEDLMDLRKEREEK